MHHKWRAEKKKKVNENPKIPQWNKLSSKHRWEKMTLSEVEKECLRLHITYGQAQVMADNGTLPKDFGKGLR